MAMVFNPITKQWEDDGTGLDAAAPVPGMEAPAAPVLAPPVAATGGGGAIPASPSATTIQIGSTKPEFESTSSRQQLIKSPGAVAADADVAASQGAFMAGSAAQEGVERQEGEVKGQAATAEEFAREQSGLDVAALEEKRRKAIEMARAEDEDQIKQVGKAHKEKNDAEIDYFKGRPAAEIFAAILRGVDRAASSIRGESGPTGVDRVLGEKIAAYKAQKLGEWERAKEVRAAKKANSAEYQEELSRQEIAINNKLLAGLEVLRTRTEKLTAQLTPEKAAAMRQQRDAAFLNHEARARQENEQNYGKLQKFEETKRSPTGVAGATDKANDTNVNDPATGQAFGQADTPAQAKEANTTLAAVENIKGDVRRIAEINAQLPKKRNPLDPEVQALQSEKDGLISGLAPKYSQAFGAGAPSTAEFQAYAKNADRGYLQDQGSFQRQSERMIANIDRIGRTKARSAGVKFSDEKPGTVGQAVRDKLGAKGGDVKPKTKPPTEGEIVRVGSKRYKIVKGKPELQP